MDRSVDMSAPRGATTRPPLLHFAPSCADLEVVMSDVSEVSAWTCDGGPLVEHAAFLLRAHDGRWHSVMMSDPMVGTLMPRLRALPGFDTDRLLDVLNARSGQIEVLWRR